MASDQLWVMANSRRATGKRKQRFRKRYLVFMEQLQKRYTKFKAVL